MYMYMYILLRTYDMHYSQHSFKGARHMYVAAVYSVA